MVRFVARLVGVGMLLVAVEGIFISSSIPVHVSEGKVLVLVVFVMITAACFSVD